MEKNAEYLRKRYMEMGPGAAQAAYLSALPEYARPMYNLSCPEHRDEDLRLWGVEEVCKFLTSLEGCGIYADVSTHVLDWLVFMCPWLFVNIMFKSEDGFGNIGPILDDRLKEKILKP